MPSTLFPLPIAVAQIKRHFTGLGDVLEALACYSGQSVEDIAGEHIRASQHDVETMTGMPYFITRFATEEIAAYPGGSSSPTDPALELGTDYDRILQPMDYVVDDWQQGSGRVRLPHKPIHQVDLYRFSFRSQGHILDLPLNWIQRNDMKGVLTLMPHGIGISGTQYFRLLLLFPFYRGSPAGTIIPNLIHLRYSAGLVDARLGEDDEYDEEAAMTPQKQTKWDQGLVQSIQRIIGLHASAPIMRELASEIDKGGASISFAGLSESVNSSVLQTRADNNEKQAIEQATKLREQIQGPIVVLI